MNTIYERLITIIKEIFDILMLIFPVVNSIIQFCGEYKCLNVLLNIVLFLCVIYLYTSRYKQKKFVNFIQYLYFNPHHQFVLLPKIILYMLNNKENNNINLEQIQINFNLKVNVDEGAKLEPETKLQCIGTMEYNLDIINHNIPKFFYFHMGNTNADNISVELMQKCGTQSDFEGILPLTPSSADPCDKLGAERYMWQLNKDVLTQGDTVPLKLKVEHVETIKANSQDTLLYYPYHFAKKTKKACISYNLECSVPNALESFTLYRIQYRRKHSQHHVVSNVKRSGDNSISVTIYPKSNEYEVYYARVKWNLLK